MSSPVELLVSQTLCWVHDDLDQVDFSCYLLKVCGQEEVLQKCVIHTQTDRRTLNVIWGSECVNIGSSVFVNGEARPWSDMA